MTTIFIFDQAEHSGGSIARAVDLAISMPNYNFIIATYHPLHQLYHRSLSSNIKTLRFFSFYNYQRKFHHTQFLHKKIGNNFLFKIARKIIAFIDWINETSLKIQASVHLADIRLDIVQANAGIHFLPYYIALKKHSSLIYYFRHLDDYRWASEEMLNRAYRFLFVGKNLMDHHRALISLPDSKCQVIHSPFNTIQRLKESPPDDMSLIDSLKANNRFIILMAARICHEKGQKIALNAIGKVAKNHPNVMLLLAGNEDKKYANQLHQEINSLQLHNNVTFIGQRTDIPHLLLKADVALQAPLWFEALSGSLVEAMQLGTLTISANIGGASEVIEHGVTGFLFTPGNSDELANIIENIIEGQIDIHALCQKGKERTNLQWNQDKIHAEMSHVYSTAISQIENIY